MICKNFTMDNRIGECVKVRPYFLSFEGYYIGLKELGKNWETKVRYRYQEHLSKNRANFLP